ncbi:ribonuclease H-like domain-containing protein [Tanacetum coccineum]
MPTIGSSPVAATRQPTSPSPQPTSTFAHSTGPPTNQPTNHSTLQPTPSAPTNPTPTLDHPPTNSIPPTPPPVPSPATTQPNRNPASTHSMVTRYCVSTNRLTQRYTLFVSTISPIPKSYNHAFQDPIARLVANDSTQLTGIDVDETFSPVIKPATIRTVLSLALSPTISLFSACCQEMLFTWLINPRLFTCKHTSWVHGSLNILDHMFVLYNDPLYGLSSPSEHGFRDFAASIAASVCFSSEYYCHFNIRYLLSYFEWCWVGHAHEGVGVLRIEKPLARETRPIVCWTALITAGLSFYMHDLETSFSDLKRILAIGLGAPLHVGLPPVIVFFLTTIYFRGLQRGKLPFSAPELLN